MKRVRICLVQVNFCLEIWHTFRIVKCTTSQATKDKYSYYIQNTFYLVRQYKSFAVLVLQKSREQAEVFNQVLVNLQAFDW